MQSDTNLARTTPTTTALFNPRRRANTHSLVRSGPSYTKLKDLKNSATGQGTVQLLLAGQEAFATNGYRLWDRRRFQLPHDIKLHQLSKALFGNRVHILLVVLILNKTNPPLGGKTNSAIEVGCPG